jgi:hypothetical protein
MKNLILIILSLLLFKAKAQVPQGISYQAVAFNSAGSPVVSSTISVRISILDNSATGVNLYTETHSRTTNTNGLYNLTIGQGIATSGTFSAINWVANSKFLKVELDPAGGTAFSLVGSSELMSVPYAFHCGTANSISSGGGSNSNTLIYLSKGF